MPTVFLIHVLISICSLISNFRRKPQQYTSVIQVNNIAIYYSSINIKILMTLNNSNFALFYIMYHTGCITQVKNRYTIGKRNNDCDIVLCDNLCFIIYTMWYFINIMWYQDLRYIIDKCIYEYATVLYLYYIMDPYDLCILCGTDLLQNKEHLLCQIYKYVIFQHFYYYEIVYKIFSRLHKVNLTLYKGDMQSKNGEESINEERHSSLYGKMYIKKLCYLANLFFIYFSKSVFLHH